MIGIFYETKFTHNSDLHKLFVSASMLLDWKTFIFASN